MTPVVSTCIAAADYDRQARVLRLQFVGGGTYDYLGVPEVVFAAFEAAESKGRFVNLAVKPHFAYRHVEIFH